MEAGTYPGPSGFLKISRPESCPNGGSTIQRCEWRPPDSIREKLPDDFVLEMDCVTSTGRAVRRFRPANSWTTFLCHAAAAGHELLINKFPDRYSRAQRFSDRLGLQLFQTYPMIREFFSRTFNAYNDLYLSLDGRSIDESVLPPHVGLNSDGTGTQWSPSELIKNGQSSGGPELSEEDYISLGLTEAARKNPLKVKDSEAGTIIRMALFDMEPASEALTGVMQAELESRFCESIEKACDKTDDKYRDWFYKARDNIIHSISKRKSNGISLSREQVRSGLLTLVWRSFELVSQCIHMLMNCFRNLLPLPLTEFEKPVFDLMYRRQNCLGGLPLVLLRDRLKVCRFAIADMLETPNDSQGAGVLMRVLEYYGQMAANRRRADREAKRQTTCRNVNGPRALIFSLDSARELETSSQNGPDFQELMLSFAEIEGIRCDDHATGLNAAVSSDSEDQTQSTILFRCNHCDWSLTRVIPLDVLRAMVKDDEDH